ncbi:MAG: hypothetical protein DIZ78_13255 [endosymbiont of Escarpia spicata]|uniref:Phosphonate ABC transporter substrate-binding protein n=1 Tax=endosymbiont of Escarpia spicata TaxID=2200908 RepID=A0A370DH02_9GAMM|nr:MAG: hypothetical protein DIZ78_13255 [endosymbiont of Escarpia spicata]
MKRFLTTMTLVTLAMFSCVTLAADMDLWFSPGWKSKGKKAKIISKVLSEQAGISIKPCIAKSYPQILKEFDSGKASLVYVGSFVSAIIRARELGEGLVQGITGKEMYSGVLVYPKDGDPASILSNDPDKIAYAVGASSGESSAKAATGGKAAVKTKNHAATVGAVKAGKAKAGVVKNWWWESKSSRYPGMAMYRIPEISIEQNPDNVLSASKGVPAADRAKIKSAAKASQAAFGAKEMRDFDPALLDFTLSLMKKGQIDSKSYSW